MSELVKTMTCADEAPKEMTASPTPPRKWTGTCGPKQAKQVNEAFKTLTWEGRTYVELTGVTGVNEDRSTMTQIFGPIREDVAKAIAAIGEQFNYTATAENFKAIIEACTIALSELQKNRPVNDKRRTPEEYAELRAKNEAYAKASTEAAELRAKEIEAHRQAHRNDFPWLDSRRPGESDHAWVGRSIRTELGLKFPGTRFSVKTDYNSARIYWELGPTEEAVKAITEKYERWGYATDDGPESEDLRKKRIEHEAISQLIGGLRYISRSRHIPTETYVEVARMICACRGIDFKDVRQHGTVDGEAPGEELGDYAYRLIGKTDWPNGAKAVKVENDPECADPRCFWKLVLTAPAAPMPAASVGATGATIRRNLEHDGIEIKFPAKPGPEVRSKIKAHGFHWSGSAGVWYKKFSPETWKLAHELLGISETPAAAPVDRFDMAVEDQMARHCGLV